MAKVPHGCTNVTDVRQTDKTDRQTDDRRQTDGRPMTYSEHELEFTFAKNETAVFDLKEMRMV